MATIGELNNISSENNVLQRGLEVDWKISDFSLRHDNFYCSPSFHFAGEAWYLKIYPDGYNSVGCIGLYLYLVNEPSGLPVHLEYTVGLKTVNGEKDTENHRRFLFDSTTTGHGVHCCILQSELSERASDLLHSDVLTVFCHVKYPTSAEFATATNTTESVTVHHRDKILQDLKQVFLKQENCDVVLRVRGSEFPAHKFMLTARSPVFASTFRNDMKEKETGTVDIEDCDPSVFPDFLCFLYSGDLENLSEKNVFGLFAAADKYDIPDLRGKCLEFMKVNLSVGTFCETLTLALLHNEAELVHLATDFFIKNARKILVTVQWQTFTAENPTQSNELVIKFADSVGDDS